MKKDNVNFVGSSAKKKAPARATLTEEDEEDIENVNFTIDTINSKQLDSPSSMSNAGIFNGLNSYFGKSSSSADSSAQKPLSTGPSSSSKAKVNSAFGASASSALTDSEDSSPGEPGCINMDCVAEIIFHISNVVVLLLTIATNLLLIQVLITENIENPVKIDYRDVGLRFYAILLSALMLMVEVNLKCVIKKMKLLDRYINRGLMYILIALITYSNSEQRVVAVSLVQTFFGGVYMFFHCLRKREVARQSVYRTVDIGRGK